MSSDQCDQVGLKSRPPCASVSVEFTMRSRRGEVEGRDERYPRALALRARVPISGQYLEVFFRTFHERIPQMSTENQKPVAPGTTKVEPATVQPTPQQNQGDAKPSTDKPAGQQK
jgi:hypothetical protein